MCTKCSLSRPEHLQQFSICFARSGFYEQRVFKRAHELHIGRLIVSKPEIEYVVRHIDDHPDMVTSLNFTREFYERVKDHYKEEAGWFFSNPNLQSILVTAHADIEFIHQHILKQMSEQSSLELDDLVLQLVEKVMNTFGNKTKVDVLPESLKRHHLTTIERARDYLFQNFSKDISLQQVAEHCCVSLFHFSRIFKSIMNRSPHQYLKEIRLNNAQLLLQIHRSLRHRDCFSKWLQQPGTFRHIVQAKICSCASFNQEVAFNKWVKTIVEEKQSMESLKEVKSIHEVKKHYKKRKRLQIESFCKYLMLQ